jgi:site-specific recombinase XerD
VNLPQIYRPVEQLASLLNTLLFGYVAIELTSEFHGLWRDRADFLDQVIALLLTGTVAHNAPQPIKVAKNYPDLPESIVHQILQQAKKQGGQTYAIVYVLFGAGLSGSEIVGLNRSDYLSSSDRQLLQIRSGSIRQVPVNQWIMGKRYGSYLKNPLTQWLKIRKDNDPALFLSIDGDALTETDLERLWQQLTSELMTPLAIAQTQSTWCVEMLMRGLTIDAMQLLIGWEASQLDYYVRRATEQAALNQAFSLDKSKS